jgi:hypothetical protein
MRMGVRFNRREGVRETKYLPFLPSSLPPVDSNTPVLVRFLTSSKET